MPDEPLDLDAIERDLPELYSQGDGDWGDVVRALIAELRAARKTIEDAADEHFERDLNDDNP